MNRALAFCIALSIGLYAGADSEDDAYVGQITNLDGHAVILRGDAEVTAEVGSQLFRSDSVRTSRRTTLGIVLSDDTRIAVGPKSELALRAFQFEPAKNVFSMVLDMVRGTFLYVSGQMAKLSPESVRLESPIGAIAVRGTKLLIKVAP